MKTANKIVATEVVKVTGEDNTFTFVLSDESPDRIGDTIVQDGWDLSSFLKNPVALWMHNHDLLPIGRWKNLRVVARQLLGDLELAPDAVSPQQKAINMLVRLGFIKATSVGFSSDDYDMDKQNGGFKFNTAHLNEASLVSVGCNPNALALAKSLCPEFLVEKAVVDATAKIIEGESEPEEELETEIVEGSEAGEESPSQEKSTPRLDEVKSFLTNFDSERSK